MVTIDYPPVNLQGQEMLADLNTLFLRLERDREVKVVVFQSAHPEIWVCHYDTNLLKDMSTETVSCEEAKLLDLQSVLERVSKLPQATIAKLEGFARSGRGCSGNPVIKKEAKTHLLHRKTIMKLNFTLLVILSSAFAMTSISDAKSLKPKSSVVLAADIQWEQLNPKRGDASPKAATLWGDRKGTVATGFLVKFVDGFSSPPHIHNVSYRGVVIAGGVHNDDPNAKPMWMPTGSFWTQPAGEVHITSSRGTGVAYVEIEKGPYLVLPEKDALDNGERSINIAPSNIVWLNASNTSWIDQSTLKSITNDGAKIAFLWGKPQDDQLNGTYVKLPAGFLGELRSQGETFQAVVIEGQTKLQLPNESEIKTLTPGSYISSEGMVIHKVQCDAEQDCLIYIRSKGKFKIIPK